MDYPLTEFLAKTHTDEGQRKSGHVTRQAGQSPVEPLEHTHTVTLGLWFLECDRKALCYTEPLRFCELTSSPKTLFFLGVTRAQEQLPRCSRDPELL